MTEYVLYSFFRSSCAARVRIALNLQGLEYDIRTVNILEDEHLAEEQKALNPSGSVPLLVVMVDGKPDLKIGQSIAILEYLNDAHSETPLLPKDAKMRAIIRTLVNIISADTQPVTNLRIIRRVEGAGCDVDKWMKDFMGAGLSAYEEVVTAWAGRYSVGDKPTMADVCLVPAVWNARHYGLDLSSFPTVQRIVKELEKLDAVQKAGYLAQPDTPAELRHQ